VPTIGGPETDAQGRVTKGKLRAWRCRVIKNGAANYAQRIECEDVDVAIIIRVFRSTVSMVTKLLKMLIEISLLR